MSTTSSIPRAWFQLQLPLTVTLILSPALMHTSSGLVMAEDEDLKQHQPPVSMQQLAVQASLV